MSTKPGEPATHFWRVVGPDGSENAVDIQSSTKRVLRVFELLTSNGYSVRAIDALEYADLCERIDAEVEVAHSTGEPR